MKASKIERWNRTVAASSVKNTEHYNKLNYVALMDPMAVLRRRLFDHSNAPWEGETFSLGCADRSNGERGDAYWERPAMSSHVHRRGHPLDEGAKCKTEKGGADSRFWPENDWLRGA